MAIPIDAVLMADLAATCNSLGYSDGSKYHKEPECIESVKDLIRFLRRDDENNEIRRALGEINVVTTDLIPIVRNCDDDQELFDVTLRLLVNLTNPVLLLYDEETPAEKVSLNYFNEVVQHLQKYKESFVDRPFWNVLCQKLTDYLSKEWDQRKEDDQLIIERILILLRNVLSIPADPQAEGRTEDDASVHDRVLWALNLVGFDRVLLYIAQSSEERNLCMHVIEIISLMLREQDATRLAASGDTRRSSEKEKDSAELANIRQQERIRKEKFLKQTTNTRHSRFGGTYTVQNLKSVSERDLICHKSLSDVQDISFDRNKKPRKTPKNRIPIQDTGTRRSTLAIRVFLKEFCIEFLNAAYNSVMNEVKSALSRSSAQAHDETYYLWAMKFFMEFNRGYHFKVDLVTETLSIPTFHYVQTQMETNLEMMTMEKRKLKRWSKRAHYVLKAYQELLLNLYKMYTSKDFHMKESAKVIMSNLFYMPEYREMCYLLLNKYDPTKMSRGFLKDLVTATHVFLKLLEHFTGGGKVVVKQKGARKRKKKSQPNQQRGTTEADLDDIWTDVSDSLTELLQEGTEVHTQTMPFDAASEVPIEDQKKEAVAKIQEKLREKNSNEAVALLRASREVWPEGEVFGAVDIEPRQEFVVLREIYFATLRQDNNEPEIIENGNDDQEIEDEEEEELPVAEERDFDFKSHLTTFASPRVLQTFGHLFKRFSTNSRDCNHYIVKMFHRVAFDLKMPAMLFQASIFRTFQELLDDPKLYNNPANKELIRFAKYILREFFKIAETNKKVFMELLFWKTKREAYEITNEYGSYKEQSRAGKLAWSEEEEEELRRLYEELKDQDDDSERDLIDRIISQLINPDRTRRGVIVRLKYMGLITNTSELKSKRKTYHVPREWSETEVQELSELWNQFRDAVDPIAVIWDRLTIKRPKIRIKEKLLEIGLVTDKKEMYKKRSSKKRSGNENIDEEGESETESSDNEEYSREETSRPGASTSGKQHAAPVAVGSPFKFSVDRCGKSVVDFMNSNPDSSVVIEWLMESIQDAIDVKQDDPEDNVALVPVAESCALAVEDGIFQQLLTKFGINKPGEGEMFWRISSEISVENLKKQHELLDKCIKGDYSVISDSDQVAETEVESGNVQNVVENGISSSISEEVVKNGDTISQNSVLSGCKSSKRNRQRVNSDSDSASENSSTILQSTNHFDNSCNELDNSLELSGKRKTDTVNVSKKGNLIESDDSEDDALTPDLSAKSFSGNRQKRNGDSKLKRNGDSGTRNRIESDDDSESDSLEVVNSSKRKKQKTNSNSQNRRFVESDDSEEESSKVSGQSRVSDYSKTFESNNSKRATRFDSDESENELPKESSNIRSPNESDDSENESPIRNSKKKKRFISDSEEDEAGRNAESFEMGDHLPKEDGVSGITPPKLKKKKRKIIEIDSEEENTER